MNYESMSDTALVTAVVKEQEKAANAKKAMNEIISELEKRSIQDIDDGVINFKRFKSSKGSVTVFKKTSSLQFANVLGLKKLIGEELFNSEVKTTSSVDYKATTMFSKALQAIVMFDYDFGLTMDEVYESLGANSDQRKLLDKKLKGKIDSDIETLEGVLGQGDYDAEAFVINKVKNAELIRTYFPGADEDTLDKIRKYVFASESLSYTVTK